MEEQSKLPVNSNFISYIRAFGPWPGSNGLYNEYSEDLLDNIQNPDFNYFFFDIEEQNLFAQEIADIINSRTSKVIFLAGKAGDGKTHFLRRICTAEQPVGMGRVFWKENKSNSVIKFTDTQRNIKYTIVKDFTELSVGSPEYNDLFETVSRIMDTGNQDESSSTDDSCEIAIIAANNGKILKEFHNHYSGSSIISKDILNSLEDYLLRGNELKSDSIICKNIGSTIDSNAIVNMFRHVLENAAWSKCQKCQHHEVCPVLSSRNELNNEIFYDRIREIFTILIDDGTHFTTRNILQLISNTLLGCKAEIPEQSFWTCEDVFAQVESGIGTGLRSACSDAAARQYMSPYDGFMGVNVRNMRSRGDGNAVFRFLENMQPGEHTTSLIDQFLMFGDSPQFSTLNEAFSTMSSMPSFGDQGRVRNILEDLATHSDVKSVQEDSDSSADGTDEITLLSELRNILTTRRRSLFFSMDERRFSPMPFDPYSLCAFKFGHKYLELKELVYSGRLKNSPAIAGTMINGLNRAFTSLMTVAETSKVTVSTNNIISPADLCMIYDKDYEKPCDFDQKIVNDCIRLIPSKKAGNCSGLICIAYYGPGDGTSDLDEEIRRVKEERDELFKKEQYNDLKKLTDKIEELEARKNSSNQIVSYLSITPKIFEYLMSLSHGMVGISFSQECAYEIMTFKSSLEAFIVKNRKVERDHDEDIGKLINRLQFCMVNDDGCIRK